MLMWSDRVYTFTYEDINFRVTMEVDESPDMDFYGEYVKQCQEWCIDRKTGVFYGESISDERTFKSLAIQAGGDDLVASSAWVQGARAPVGLSLWQPHPSFPMIKKVEVESEEFGDVYALVNTAIDGEDAVEWLEKFLPVLVEFGFDEYLDPDGDETQTIVYGSGYEHVRDDLGRHYEQNDYQFFVPYQDGTPGEGWDHVDEKTKQEVIEKHGSLRDANIDYMVQSYDRIEDYNNNGWCMLGMCVAAFTDQTELASDSLWGLASDDSEESSMDILKELVSSVWRQMKDNADAEAKRLREAAEAAAKAVKLPPPTLEFIEEEMEENATRRY